VELLKESGFYADGHGLYLRVGSATSRSWVFVWHERGKRREMGLGSLVAVSLRAGSWAIAPLAPPRHDRMT
jgi:hypothetical protein